MTKRTGRGTSSTRKPTAAQLRNFLKTSKVPEYWANVHKAAKQKIKSQGGSPSEISNKRKTQGKVAREMIKTVKRTTGK